MMVTERSRRCIQCNSKNYTVDGTLNGNTGIRLSAVGSYNPALDISSPIFKQLNAEAEDAFESDFSPRRLHHAIF